MALFTTPLPKSAQVKICQHRHHHAKFIQFCTLETPKLRYFTFFPIAGSLNPNHAEESFGVLTLVGFTRVPSGIRVSKPGFLTWHKQAGMKPGPLKHVLIKTSWTRDSELYLIKLFDWKISSLSPLSSRLFGPFERIVIPVSSRVMRYGCPQGSR